MPEQSDDKTSTGGLEGKYANYFQVGHNASEFVIDFGQMYSGSSAQFHTRIITSPFYAKELLKVLRESIDRYQHHCGPIKQND